METMQSFKQLLKQRLLETAAGTRPVAIGTWESRSRFIISSGRLPSIAASC